MRIDTLKGLLTNLEEQLIEQVADNPYGGRALVERLQKVVKSKNLEQLTEDDLASLTEKMPAVTGEDSKDLLEAYMDSLVNPAELTEDQVSLLNTVKGSDSVTKTSDLTDFAYLQVVSSDGGSMSNKLTEKMVPKIEFEDSKLVAKLTHPEALDKDGKSVDLISKKDELPDNGYGYVAPTDGKDAVPAKLANDDAAASVAFMEQLLAQLEGLEDEGDQSKRTLKDIAEFAGDAKKIDGLLAEITKVRNTITEDKALMSDLSDKAQGKVNVKEFDSLKFDSKDAEKFTPIEKSDENKELSDAEIKQVNEINERQAKLCTGSGEFENGLKLTELEGKLSLLKYMSTGNFKEQNTLIEEKGIVSSMNEIQKNSKLEKEFQAYVSNRTKAIDEAKKGKGEDKKDGEKDASDADASKKKPKTEKEVLGIIQSYASMIKDAKSEIAKSESYVSFLKEAKKIDSLVGKVKTLFDSRRAISKPLYAVLAAVAVASLTLVAPVAYTTAITGIALSALTYAAGKILTIRDIAARQKVAMSDVSSDAITVSSKWEIAATVATTAAAAVFSPAVLGLARYAEFFNRTARIAFSAFVTTTVNVKEFSVNRKTPLLTSGNEQKGTVSSKEALTKLAEAEADNLSSYNEVLVPAAKNSKQSVSTDMEVSDKVKDENVKAVFKKSLELSGKISKLDTDEDVKAAQNLVKTVTDFVASSEFKTASSHNDMKLQPKGSVLISQVKNASENLVNAARLVQGRELSKDWNTRTHLASLDFGLAELVGPA